MHPDQRHVREAKFAVLVANSAGRATHPQVSYPQRMRSLAQIGHAAVVAAALLASSTSSIGRVGHLDQRSQQDQDLERLLNLMAPLAQAVLGSFDREALEANIDEQLFSGLFSDLLVKSIQALGQHPRPDDADEPREQRFLMAIEELGGDRAKADRALWLSQVSSQLSFTSFQALAGIEGADDVKAIDRIESISRFDLQKFLYDIEVPVEIREGTQGDFESAICMFALAYAIAEHVDAPAWLIGELVERWLAGQMKLLPVVVAITLKQGVALGDVLSDDILIRLDELLEHTDIPDLDAAQHRADTMVAGLDTIAEHANRQPDGVWPKT